MRIRPFGQQLCFYVALFTIRSRSHVRGITRPSYWKEDGNETAAE